MESNYETLSLNEQIAVAAYHGGRFFPTSCHSNSQSQASKGGAPVIDYFDYVNPSEAEESGKDEEEEKEMVSKSWADEVEREENNNQEDDTGENRISTAKTLANKNTQFEKGTEIQQKHSPDLDKQSEVKSIEESEITTYQRSETNVAPSEGIMRRKKRVRSEKCTAEHKENHSNPTTSKPDQILTAECTTHAAIEIHTNVKTADSSGSEVVKLDRGKTRVKEQSARVTEEKGQTELKRKSNKTKEKAKPDSREKNESDVKDTDITNEDQEVSETVQTNIGPGFHTINRPEYRTALQVDTSYTAGVSSDSNCSQYSVSSWTSEQDTSSSLDPSPNPWCSYNIDSGVSFGTSTGIHSDTSDVSGEDCSLYETNQRPHSDFHSTFDGKSVQIFTRFPCSTKLCYSADTCSNSEFNGAIQNENGAFPNVTIYNDNLGVSVMNYDGYRDLSDHVPGDSREVTCDYCGYCMCSMFETCSRERLCPGEVFYYSSNSMVLCVRQSKLPLRGLAKPQVSKLKLKTNILELHF